MRQMQIVLAYIVQVVGFHLVPSWQEVVGASLILITVIAITQEKRFCGPEEGTEDDKDCDKDDGGKGYDNPAYKSHESLEKDT